MEYLQFTEEWIRKEERTYSKRASVGLWTRTRVMLSVCVSVCAVPATRSSRWLRPQSASFQLIGHNLSLHLQLPGQPLKLELLQEHRRDKKTQCFQWFQLLYNNNNNIFVCPCLGKEWFFPPQTKQDDCCVCRNARKSPALSEWAQMELTE